MERITFFLLEEKGKIFLPGVGGMSSNKWRLTQRWVLGVEGGLTGVVGLSDKAKSLAKSAGSVKGGRGGRLNVIVVHGVEET